MRTVPQNDWVAGQTYTGRPKDELDDVLLEYMCLRLAGRQEYLIAARSHCVDHRFSGKVPGRSDLSRLQDDARTLGSGSVPEGLIIEQTITEFGKELFLHFLGQLVLRWLSAGALRPARVQVELVATILISPDACQSFDLPPKQIDFFEVGTSFFFLSDQLQEPRLESGFDPNDSLSRVPLVAGLPALDRRSRLGKVIGDGRDGPALPVKEAGHPSIVVS